MQVKLTTLSPLHIGSGETFEPLDFFQDRSVKPPAICYISFEELYPYFKQKHWALFTAWIERNERGRGANWYHFFRDALRDLGYYDKIASQLKRRVENRSIQMISQSIFAFIRSGRMPYLPGSSLKGALRNALAYALLAKDSTESYSKLKSHLERAQSGKEDRRKVVKSASERLDKMLFRVGESNDAKYDLLRFLHVGDSQPWDETQLFVSYIQVKGLSRSVNIPHEFCPAGQVIKVPLAFSSKYLEELGFNTEQRRLASIENLFEACYHFAGSLIKEESAYFRSKEMWDVAEQLESFNSKNSPDAPLVRLGKHTGFLSSTVSLSVKQQDFSLYDNVIRTATRGRSYAKSFPKTRRLVTNGKILESPGWLKLERV